MWLDFLGVPIKRLDNNKIELTETCSIKQIKEVMGIVGANQKATPAETEELPADKQGDPTEASFNYASIFGMQAHCGTDITFAIFSQSMQ